MLIGEINFNTMIKQQKAFFPNKRIEENNIFNKKHQNRITIIFENMDNFDIDYNETFDKLNNLSLK